MKLSREQKETLTKAQYRHFKQTGELPSVSVVDTVEQIEMPQVTVLCVRFGTKYGIDYVERLRNMVARHLSIPYEFCCLTDDPRPIDGVKLLLQQSAGYTKPWWHKVHMFDPRLDVQGRILYFDLDVIIGNSLDKLLDNLGDNFMGIQDFNRKFHPNWRALNSSVMSWQHRSQSDIWNKFAENPTAAQRLHGDQDWIWQMAANRIKFWPVPWIQSYKWELRGRDELIVRTGKGGFKTVMTDPIDQECSVAVFHGDPKPEDVQDAFVVDNWQ
jgi:hypothetical protein